MASNETVVATAAPVETVGKAMTEDEIKLVSQLLLLLPLRGLELSREGLSDGVVVLLWATETRKE